jgi:hypothetical protein
MFQPKRVEMRSVTGITSILKSKMMRYVAHVVFMENKRNDAGLWWGNLKNRHNVEDLSNSARIILKHPKQI